ncbi:MAG: BLUF domain-containing protein [Solirubrobacteraceae bacterium]
MYERVDTEHDNEPVFRLIYSSHSRIPAADTPSELGEIFTTARRNNRALGVTGALVVSEDAFSQALEGDEQVVRDLYARIGEDPRHEHVTLLRAETVPGRTFGRWAMAKVAADGGPDIRLLSNAQRQTIVAAGADHHVTPDQESVLSFMRDSVDQPVIPQ